jgi:quercetin dioxygenase-like cupin family protein
MAAMKTMNRRDLCTALASLSLVKSLEAQSPAEARLTQSVGYQYDKLPVTHQAGGAEMRSILHGVVATGEMVDIHETTLPPGQMPHPPHKHVHTEFMLVREGTLEFYNDGRTETIGSGGLIYAASGVMHGWKNIGRTPATYFVFALGDPKV